MEIHIFFVENFGEDKDLLNVTPALDDDGDETPGCYPPPPP